jgi:hypothetical protein
LKKRGIYEFQNGSSRLELSWRLKEESTLLQQKKNYTKNHSNIEEKSSYGFSAAESESDASLYNPETCYLAA